MKQAVSSRRPLEISDPLLAELLLDPQARRVLRPFIGGAKTVGEAAHELGVKPNTLFKRVKALERLGLLRVAHEQPRAGRAVKLYRCVAESFFVPFRATSLETLEALFYTATEEPNRRIASGLAHQLIAQAPRLGYLVTPYRNTLRHDLSLDGHTEYDALRPENPAFVRAWPVLRLDPERAKRFQAELMGLLERYADGWGERYQVYLAFAPLLPE